MRIAATSISLPGRRPFQLYRAGPLGRHQAANAALAGAAADESRKSGWTIPEAVVRRGLADVVSPAPDRGRRAMRLAILHAARQRCSRRGLVEALGESFAARRRRLTFATTQDKDLRGMLERLVGRFDEELTSTAT